MNKEKTAFDRMLEMYLERVRSCKDKPVDTILAYLLDAYKDDVRNLYNEDINRFHKSFRQMDIITPQGVDSAIWVAIYHSELFWDCVHKTLEDKFL